MGKVVPHGSVGGEAVTEPTCMCNSVGEVGCHSTFSLPSPSPALKRVGVNRVPFLKKNQYTRCLESRAGAERSNLSVTGLLRLRAYILLTQDGVIIL